MLHVSILTMLAVTAERYNALCHPFKRRMACTVRTTVKAVLGIWLLACILSLPFLIMTELEDATFYDGSPIKVCRTKIDEMWKYCYTVLIFILFFVVPFFVLVFMYTSIIRQLLSDSLRTLTRNDPSAIYTLRSRKQVVRMLIFIVILFFVSLFPIRVVTLWLIFTPARNVSKIGLEAYLNLVSWARILMYVNSAGNPIIYSLTSTKFKMAFNRVVRRYKPCPKRTLLTNNSTRSSFTRKRQYNTGENHPSCMYQMHTS